jgi:hypothetical protein
MRNYNWICGRCEHAIAEEVHHRDGDPGNNSFLNLLPVCRNCHQELEAENPQSQSASGSPVNGSTLRAPTHG